VTPVRHQTYGYLSSCRASLPCDLYQIVLVGDRGRCRVTSRPPGVDLSRKSDVVPTTPPCHPRVCVCSMCWLDVLGTSLLPTVHVRLRLQRPYLAYGVEPVSDPRSSTGQHQQRQRGVRTQQHATGMYSRLRPTRAI